MKCSAGRAFLLGTGCIAGALAALNLAVDLFGLRINTSPSVPLGLYGLERRPLRRGDVISICPRSDEAVWRTAEERGYLGIGICRGGAPRLFKPVIALPGDVVSIRAEGVSVAGRVVPRSKPQTKDRRGRLLAPAVLSGTLGRDEVLTVSDSVMAFDSRYFGPVRMDDVEGTIVPLLVWEGK